MVLFFLLLSATSFLTIYRMIIVTLSVREGSLYLTKTLDTLSTEIQNRKSKIENGFVSRRWT